MIGTYDPAEPLAYLIRQLKMRRWFARAGGKKIDNAMMVLKGITLLAQIETFNKVI